MNKINVLTNATTSLFFCISLNVNAQHTGNNTFGPRNNMNAQIGLIDLNINYERNIIQRSGSLSYVRLGFGYGAFLVAGEGKYVNGGFVHLIGKKDSHLEADLGIKYMVTNSISDPKFSETVIPDVFLGYRFEKSSGGFIFRGGLNYPTFINLGFGYKF